MMACGLPCVELASESMVATFGPMVTRSTLAEPDPLALCAAIERLLEDSARRQAASKAGVKLMAERTWERAAAQLQEGLHEALRSAAGVSR